MSDLTSAWIKKIKKLICRHDYVASPFQSLSGDEQGYECKKCGKYKFICTYTGKEIS